ncbi:phospholipase D family protein [Pseudoruegeria sp. SHC-113]|uniref:phospholipase D family protein n=1 Tax=Pseudoruegeria sp. SHC-113 TaxID=2855439 RepID=UPI0021BB0D57|nr:phospholipase D family protein [Pseudoruegeria sp. SHC-113]MCT8160823.1 phospholipase D family protein [Pseudoruegeria sp. SHC-113]
MVANQRLSRVFAGALALSVGLAGCTYVPFDPPPPASRAAPPAQVGNVAKVNRDLRRDVPGKSVFVPMADGNDALAARLRLIEDAQETLDLQYFLGKPDQAGALIGLKLLEAAERGVRVRLLLDDVFTTSTDTQLAVLDNHPNLELRIFNPMSRRSPTVVNYLLDFGRVNRRMHNKLFIADGGAAIIGGRNIADEYYQLDTSSEFADFDMFVAGPSVAAMSEAFDLFWNDAWSVPVNRLNVRVTEEELTEARRAFERRAATAEAGIYRKAMQAPILRELREGKRFLSFGHAKLVTDPPDKLRVRVTDGERTTSDALFNLMGNAREEVILYTPYFVPQDYGTDFFERLAATGVKVRVVTNSLAATNHAYVHGGYTPYRKRLAAAGVELYEVRYDAPTILGEVPPESPIRLTMHTKAAVVDRRYVFVGSLNFDPRSIKVNTEVGMFIDDPVSGARFAKAFDEGIDDYTYQVELDEKGNLRWRYTGAGRNELYTREPDASFFARFLAGAARFLPVEGQL